jgi:hypothetical protein
MPLFTDEICTHRPKKRSIHPSQSSLCQCQELLWEPHQDQTKLPEPQINLHNAPHNKVLIHRSLKRHSKQGTDVVVTLEETVARAGEAAAAVAMVEE